MRLKRLSVTVIWLAVLSFFGGVAHAVPTNVNTSKLAGYQAETTIAINPTNPNQLFVASNMSSAGMFAAFSTDGGATWKYVDPSDGTIADGGDALPSACCDGQATFDKFGNLFLTYLDDDLVNGPHVIVISSNNGGQSFTQRAKITMRSSRATSRFRAKSGCQNCGVPSGKASGKAAFSALGDQPTISTGAGSVWVTYSDNGTITAAGASVTGVGAVGTFGTPQTVSGSNGNFGDIAIGPTGQVLVCWQEPGDGQGPETIFASLDADGLGAGGFAAPITVSATNVGGFDNIPAQNTRSVDAEANLAWDTSGGANNGRIYMSYTDEAPNESDDTNIFVRFSDNNGSTWSAPLRVNDDTGTNSQFFPTIAVDPTSGQIAVAFYDCRNDSGSGATDHDGKPNTDVQVFAAVSSDGGATFGANIQVSEGSSNGPAANNPNEFGDYNEIAFFGGNFYPVWADNSNSTGDNPDGALKSFDVYTAKVSAPAPVPGLSIDNVVANEGSVAVPGSAAFTVTLSAASTQTVTVNFATANGTALAGSDFVNATGTLTFAPGETTKTITVTFIGDAVVEPDETFVVNLTQPTNATLDTAQGTGTITNDDANVPSLSIADAAAVNEGSAALPGSATFTVTLSAASTQTVTVIFGTANGTAIVGSDFVNATGTLTFAPNETTKTITVTFIGDAVVEPNETFVVNLAQPTNATISDGQAQGIILNDDAAPLPDLSINDVTVTEGNTGTTNATFTLTLSAASTQTVSVDYATADGTATAGSDYSAKTGTVTFAPGEVSKTIVVLVNGDTQFEPNETFFVNLTAPVNATLADAQGQGTITNDDSVPQLSINDVTVTEGNSGTTNATFTVTLSAASAQTVSVNAIPFNGSARAPGDYISGGATLTFAPGQTTQIFSVPVVGDTLDEIDEVFYVVLSSPVNAAIASGRGRGTCTIKDDDGAPSITIEDVSIGEGNTGLRTAVFRLHLSAPSGQLVKVSYSTSNGTATGDDDYVAVSNKQIAFTTGQTVALARVIINGDLLNEPNETFYVNLSNAIGANVTRKQATGVILNDDRAPAITVNDASIIEGNSGQKSLTFTVSLSAASGQTVTINYATADGTARASSDYLGVSGTFAFAPGQTSKTIGVPVLGDTLVEPNELLYFLLTNATNATVGRGRGVGTILNDDASG